MAAKYSSLFRLDGKDALITGASRVSAKRWRKQGISEAMAQAGYQRSDGAGLDGGYSVN